MIERLAWVTTGEARGRDDDEPLALAALQRCGVGVEVVDWHDRDVRWAGYDRAVLRSTWDYPQRLDEFQAWLDAVDDVTEVVNPVPLVRWNLDKHYLAELADAGVPVVPSTFVERGEAADLPEGGFVVKPAVGAGSRDTAAYDPAQHRQAHDHVERLHAQGDSVVVQPLVASVPVDGEWPLVFLDGAYSHAANKRVALPSVGTVDDLFAEEQNTPHVATDAQVAAAQAAVEVVAARFGVPTYARVDLVRDDGGGYQVLELELIEPSLFLPQGGPDAATRLASALTR